MAIETGSHSFPGIPESNAQRAVLVGGIISSIPFVYGAAKYLIERAYNYTPARSEVFRSQEEIELQPGDVIEGASFLEVDKDNELQFHGPDPHLTEVILLNGQDPTLAH